MINYAFMYFICAFAVFHKGVSALVHTERTVMAAVGQEAHFTCQLKQNKDVVQVTWKKVLPRGEKSMATSHVKFGQRVNPDFRDKVEFRDSGLQSSSIVLRNVTEEDEGCYHCLFNANPEGALTGVTCLLLYELHEPVLHVESNSSEEAVVSCCATGRPAPTLTLRVLQQHLHLSDRGSVSVPNANGTLTVTRTALLSGLRDDSTQVGCAGGVLSGPQMEVFMRIPEVRQSTDEDSDEESGSNNRGRTVSIPVLSMVLACIAAFGFFVLKRKHQLRDLEMIERSETALTDSLRTSLGSNQIRHRSKGSPTSQAGVNSNPSTAAASTP